MVVTEVMVQMDKDGARGNDGYNGHDGLNGSNGSNGRDGSNGSQGLKGDKGDQGYAGSNGSNGSQGVQGLKGDRGNDGSNGANGSNGSQGLQGLKGDRGDSGISTTIKPCSNRSVRITRQSDGTLVSVTPGDGHTTLDWGQSGQQAPSYSIGGTQTCTVYVDSNGKVCTTNPSHGTCANPL
jgi:hypothetical protein